jgi:uncharacterized membrane protein (Fun14 family)
MAKSFLAVGAATVGGLASWIGNITSPAMAEIGGSYLGGFLLGWAFRRFLRMAAMIVAVTLACIAALKATGWMDLDWVSTTRWYATLPSGNLPECVLLNIAVITTAGLVALFIELYLRRRETFSASQVIPFHRFAATVSIVLLAPLLLFILFTQFVGFRAHLDAIYTLASLGGLPLCDHNLLRFHHGRGLTVDQLADMFGSSRAAMVRQLARIRDRLLRDTRRGLAARLPLDKHQLDQLIDVARRRFDLAITRVLRG